MTWCKDTARDAAVRAAEDNRTGPLPTLQEAIVLAFGFDKASAQRACDEVKSWPEDVQKDCRVVLGDSLEQGVERLQALVEVWRWGKGLLAARYPAMIPKSGSATSAPEHENKGDRMATHGLRTERVTLQIAHWGPESAARWDFAYCFSELYPLESVRVVEEEERDARTSTAGEGSCAAPAASGGAAQQSVSAGTSGVPLGDRSQNGRLEAASGGNRPETPDGSSQAAKPELPTD